jgi:Domain of unknown function (DUF4845)
MKKQLGLTLSGFITWALILAFSALLAFKLMPVYLDDLTVKKHFKAIAGDSTYSNGIRGPIETAYNKRMEIDRIDHISSKDIVISKVGGGIVLSASYTKCVPLVYNIRACMDFETSSQ